MAIKDTAWRSELVKRTLERETMLANQQEAANALVNRKPSKGFAPGDRETAMTPDKSRARI